MALRDWLPRPPAATTPISDQRSPPTAQVGRTDEIRAVATATVATPATDSANDHEGVATVAPVAVAGSKTLERQASTSERAELERLIATVLVDSSDADRAEALTVAAADADAALTSFRALVADLTPATHVSADDRRPCTACANLAWNGECRVAAHDARVCGSARRYFPITDLPQHCVGYAPKKGDPDQRSGAERWPSLVKKDR